MNCVYTIWPADREGVQAATPSAWHQDRYWLVLDVTEGIDAARVVEGPVTRETAIRRQMEMSAIAQSKASREDVS